MADKPSSEQEAAIRLLENNKLSLLTGGPGRGKTFTLAHWVKQTSDIETWCFAPTGKAAQQMMLAFAKSGIHLSAKTIHSGLIPTRTGYDGRGWEFNYNADNPLPCQRVIVDENSMIDVPTFSWLLDAISYDTKVVLVGDPDQLPPVGKGKPFIDLINSGLVPHAHLTEIHRFAGRIAHVCDQVNRGEKITTSPKLDLDVNASEIGPENLRHFEKRNPAQSLDTLDKLVEKMKDRGYSPISDIQVLVARNTEGALNRVAVNTRMQKLVNPDGYTIKDCPYRVGDRVMCLKNGLYKCFELVDWGTRGDVVNLNRPTYIANGETGVVTHIDSKAIYVNFGNAMVEFTKAGWTSMVTLAYAITTHKSQGATIPVVIYMIDDTRLVDRSLVYTALSRSKEICLTVGMISTLNKQIKNVKVDKRKTFMQEILWKNSSRSTSQ